MVKVHPPLRSLTATLPPAQERDPQAVAASVVSRRGKYSEQIYQNVQSQVRVSVQAKSLSVPCSGRPAPVP
jgi:hypothetical protein